MAFTSALPPKSQKPLSESLRLGNNGTLLFLVKNNISLSSWLLIGGFLQVLLTLFVPSLYILIPTLLILLSRFGYTLLVSFDILPNTALKDSILYRVAGQVPNLDGEFSNTGGSEKVVCFHLGAKYNHPLGAFAPNVAEIAGRFTKMNIQLDNEMGSNGYLGGSIFWSPDPKSGAMELSFISYWRSIEAIHDFAYGPIHKSGWDWWNNLTESESKHIGINHEIFASEPGQWEAIYVNHQPTLLGATTYLKKGDKMIGGTVEDKWITGLVDASKGKLRASAGRLGWQPEKLYEKYDRVPPKVKSGYEG